MRDAWREGLFGWPVTDCVVTMIDCGYSVADGPPSLRGPTQHVRRLPQADADGAHAEALARPGRAVCEPLARVTLDIPAWALGTLLSLLSKLRSVVEDQAPRGNEMVVVAVLTAANAQELHRTLPEVSGGEGVLESAFAGYQPVRSARGPRRPPSSAQR